jgi:hypothetical protein
VQDQPPTTKQVVEIPEQDQQEQKVIHIPTQEQQVILPLPVQLQEIPAFRNLLRIKTSADGLRPEVEELICFTNNDIRLVTTAATSEDIITSMKHLIHQLLQLVNYYYRLPHHPEEYHYLDVEK